jgi:Ribosomal protein L7/L12 C-terminal domain
MPQLPDETVVRISEALYNGRKIEAIRVYREATSRGLKESKDFIEALEAQLRQETPEKFKVAPGGVSCATVVAVMMLTAAVVWLVYQLLM